MSKKLIIDPPEGWMHGFPKPLPSDVDDITEWLVKEGYPREKIEEAGEYFYCRYWEGEPTDDEE
ncbi:MAG: hypothetical protein EBY41_00320 [Proteobacteria bacterium]|nr:hypothetical protein [Pseudomonadota bacterium]